MDSDRWRRIESLFTAAVKLPPERRAEFLARSCDDASLREEVHDLLRQDAAADARLDGVVQRAAGEFVEAQSVALIGRRIGSWELRSRIAQGGMGTVYLAERIDGKFEQRVAVKLLNPAALSADAFNRFDSERRILASLNHPNIARLFDGGTTEEGVPYLVMEYIEGLCIDAWCRERALTIPARLKLFLKVCAAVDFAHRNLVVHRDIKPSNILVDEHGEPKLLDFGVAKLVEQAAVGLAPAATIAELRALTPKYASPEQLKGDTITTATDVYSLGILLYELLSGRFPYRDSTASPQALQQAICEQMPERPSAAVTREAAADETLAAPPERLRRQLSGDLDNIVLMALRKEPERRYGSARQLAEDIERHLRDQPIAARPDRWAYRAQKFVARHRAGVFGAAAVSVTIVAIVLFYTTRLAIERDRAQLEARKAAEVAQFLTELFREADPNQAIGNETTARVLLERGAERIERELAHSPGVRAALMHAIAESYANMAEYPSARKQAEAALRIQQQEFQASADESLRLLYARILLELGDYDAAETEYRAAYARGVAEHGAQSREAANTLLQLAYLQRVRSQIPQAQEQLERAIAILRSVSSSDADGTTLDLARALDDYGVLLFRLDRWDASEAALREALRIKTAVVGERHPEIVTTTNNLGMFYQAHGQLPQAIATWERTIALGRQLFGEGSLRVARYQANLGSAQYDLGRYADSERNSRAALTVFRRVLGEEHPHVAFLLDNIANNLVDQGKPDVALDIYRESIAKLTKIFGADHAEVGTSLLNEGGALLALERYAQASEVLERGRTILSKHLGPEHRHVINARAKLGEAMLGRGELAGAEQEFRDVIAAMQKIYADPTPDLARAQANLGAVLLKRDRTVEAEQQLRQALETWSKVDKDADNITIARTQAQLGHALLRLRRHADAQVLLAAAYPKMREQLGEQHREVVQAALDLEQCRAAKPGQR